MLEFKELQNFVAVAERLSVSGAAKVVHLSQPALSRQIQALERKLGVKLFERIGKRLVLTAEGDDLLMHSAQLLDQAQALINRAYGLEHGHVGLLRIGASPQTISGLISPVITEFARLYPNVNLVISEAHNDALVELVENGGVHMAIASRSNTCNLVGRELFKAELFAVLPENHPARGSGRSTSASWRTTASWCSGAASSPASSSITPVPVPACGRASCSKATAPTR